MTQARFDKQGRRLPDTGRGCGCRLCEESLSARYERRSDPNRSGVWSSMQRRLGRFVQGWGGRGRSELA